MKITMQQLLDHSSVNVDALHMWIDEKWLIPDQSSTEILFSDIDIARARFVQDLQEKMGINDAGVGVVLDLVDQLHGLRKTLSQLRYALRDTCS